MTQAALAPSTFPSLAAIFAPRPQVPAPRDLTREEIDQLALIGQRIAALLHGAKRHPLDILRLSERLLSEPLSRLIGATAGQVEPKLSQHLKDACWELSAIGSIGDTLDPEDDREDCLNLVEDVLDDAANALRFALHHAGGCR